MTGSDIPSLPHRDPAGHKGTFGSVAVIGGCAHKRALDPSDTTPGSLHMLGGPCFTATAALRTGAGLAKLLLPESLVDHALTIAPSATAIGIPVGPDGDLVPHEAAAVVDSILGDSHCLAVGPGLGVSPGARAALVRAITQDTVPVVLDADALNNLPDIPEFTADLRAPAVLTPHPGEYARLAAALGITADPTDDAQRPEAAERLAQRTGAIVVLKGARTVITDGLQTHTHDHPNPALATAGTGDVLTGVIAGLIAQFVRLSPVARLSRAVSSPPTLTLLDAARLAVAIHARAAADWCAAADATAGLLATDLLTHLPNAAEAFRNR